MIGVTNPFVICITGSRTFVNPKPIDEALQRYINKYGADNILLREGEARGADKLSKIRAKKLGIKNIQERPVEYYGYSWDKDGKNAGNLRNAAMLDEEPIPNVVLVFPDDNSRGTWNMTADAKTRNIETVIYEGALSHTNPHISTSIATDIAFGKPQEVSAAMLVADELYPGSIVHQLPEYSDLDFAVTKGGEVKVFLEIKARRVPHTQYNTTILPLRKHEIAKAIYESLKIQTLAIIVFTDALVSFHLENPPDDTQFVKRDDRDKGMDHAFYMHSRFTYHMRKD